MKNANVLNLKSIFYNFELSLTIFILNPNLYLDCRTEGYKLNMLPVILIVTSKYFLSGNSG